MVNGELRMLNRKKIILYTAVLFFAVIIPFTLHAQVQVNATVDKTSLNLGDVLRYTITVKRQSQGGMTRSPDINPPTFEGFRVGGSYSSSRVNIVNNAAEVVTSYRFDLVAIKSGQVTIGPAKVKFYNSAAKKYETAQTQPIMINVGAGKRKLQRTPPTPTPEPEPDIREIKTKLEFRMSDILPFIILGIIFIIIVAIAAFILLKKQPEEKPVEVEIDYRKEALKKIKKSGEFLKRGEVKDFYYNVYEAVRFFLSHRLNDSFDELTTMEIIKKLKEKKMKEQKINELMEFMKDCDIVKFADYLPKDSENENIIEQAVKIVETY